MSYEMTIGGKTARSKFTPKTVMVDWDNLPEVSKQFAIQYGLKQYLADGAAGSESQADFESGIDARLDNLTSGEFKRTREGAGPTDSVEVLARRLASDEVTAALKTAGKKLEKEAKAAVVDAHLGKNADRLKKAAKAQIDARKAAADAVDLSEFGL